MNNQIDKHIIDKVNEEHNAVVSSSKEAIQHAMNAGKLLTDIKAMCEHGEFGKVIDTGFEFSQDTAQRYMKVHAYSAKTAELRNLQEAYKLIETEEAKKKSLEAKETHARLEYRDKYGEKPETWQRSDDYAWKKMQDDRQARNKRIEDFKHQMDQTKQANNIEDEELKADTERLKNYFKTEANKQEDLLNLNITNQNGSILDFIGSYLNGLSTDEQRMEECHNIIKFCKNESIKLQSPQK